MNKSTILWEFLGCVTELLVIGDIKRVNIGAAEAAVVPSPSPQMQIFLCRSLQQFINPCGWRWGVAELGVEVCRGENMIYLGWRAAVTNAIF